MLSRRASGQAMYTMVAIEMVDTSSNFLILSAYVGSKFIITAKATAPNPVTIVSMAGR